MSDDSQTPLPWTGNYNARGASLTFTNAEGIPFVYYFCLIDFPSSYSWMGEGSPLSYNSVARIDNPGTFDYSTTVQYLAVDRNLVFYENSYYYCIADTMGDFKSECWLNAGAQSYQLNYGFKGSDWPQGQDGDTIVTYMFPLFTTDANYSQSTGPIISFVVTNESASSAIVGDPNSRKPPVVNLPLGPQGGGTIGIPQVVVFTSATYVTDWNTWILPCVNPGQAGFSNKIEFFPGTGNIYNGIVGTNDNQTGMIAAIGCITANNDVPIDGFTINEGTVFPLSNPISSSERYYVL